MPVLSGKKSQSCGMFGFARKGQRFYFTQANSSDLSDIAWPALPAWTTHNNPSLLSGPKRHGRYVCTSSFYTCPRGGHDRKLHWKYALIGWRGCFPKNTKTPLKGPTPKPTFGYFFAQGCLYLALNRRSADDTACYADQRPRCRKSNMKGTKRLHMY